MHTQLRISFLLWPPFYLHSASNFSCSASVHSHRLGHAASETRLPHSCHDLCFGSLEHSDHLGEGGPNIRIRVPAAAHDLSQDGQTIVWYCWTDTFVYNSKSRLHSSHVLEGKHPSDQLPQDNTKAINIDFLGVRPVLDHLPASHRVKCMQVERN